MKIWLTYEFDDSNPYAVLHGEFKAFDSYEKMYQYISDRLDEFVPTEKERKQLCEDVWDDIPDWETYKRVSIELNEIGEIRWKEMEVK